MASKSAARARGAQLLEAFRAAGAAEIQPDILQPAGTLLDLYGEDIRARAYVTADPIRGEQMLRPDFTVPVVQEHMANGAEPARYCYLGEVFRKQDHRGAQRVSEYNQVGYEVFDRTSPEAADAEVFVLIAAQLAHLPLTATIGDIGILSAVIEGLDTLPARYGEVLLNLLDRLESSALFTEESCSFSQKDLVDNLKLWADKAQAQLQQLQA